ncbi:MAG: FHA domain-containing protein [Planctomycetes bacterium]|nr:FHA domain-containing protein [Planctomycetota bacterium]
MSDQSQNEAESKTATIEFLSGSRREDIQTISIPGTYRIGCGEDCEIIFDAGSEPFVSRLHAEIVLTDFKAVVSDLGSSNGTIVNGVVISEPRDIHSGDVIEFGSRGPRIRFLARGKNFQQNLVGRHTVVIAKESTQKNSMPEKRKNPRVEISMVILAFVCLLASIAYMLHNSGRQDMQVENLQHEIDMTRKQVKDAGEAGRDLADKYSAAVYLVALRVKKEGFEGRDGALPVGYLHSGGTAWAFDASGRLATNAHVVTGSRELLDAYGDFFELVAVQNTTGDIYKIKDIKINPGAKDKTSPDYLVSDIALLTLDKPVPVTFPLADDAGITGLSPGVLVYTIGFPIEHNGALRQFYGYESPDKVIGTTRFGWIQRLTSAEGSITSPEKRRLVHVGIACTGGQSGSPLFTSDGNVVAVLNATVQQNMSGRGNLVPHLGQFAYAVRVDVLRDMLVDEKNQTAKTEK